MRNQLAALIALCAASFLIGLGADGITRSQEGRVLETAREMRARGDYLIPQLLGQPRFEKPPLLYWLTAAGYTLSGRVNELGGRVPVALFGTGCVLLLLVLGRRHLSERAGFLAGLALATGPLFVQHTRLAETDVPQAFFVTAALLAFLEEQPLLGWITMGVGFLNKGPGALVIPLVTLVAWRWWAGDLRALKRDCRWPFILLFLAISLSWYLLVLWSQHESIRIFTTELSILAVKAEERHTEGFFYYFKEIFNFAPWCLLALGGLPWAFARLRRTETDSSEPARRGLKFALTWFLATFVILMATKNKQRHYLIALLPSCALLAGWTLDRLAAWRRWVMPATVAVGVALAGFNIYKCAYRTPRHSDEVALRNFVRGITPLVPANEELALVQSAVHDRNRMALAFYSQRVPMLDEAAVARRIRDGQRLSVVTTGGPLPAPMQEMTRAKVGNLVWSLWRRP